ncbi:MAG: hypothetical protein K2N25_06950 [Muribaculaceae bacterium]|nr:hypothetical protein [Muribaculaceae bacterium]
MKSNIKTILLISGLTCAGIPAFGVSTRNIQIEHSSVVPLKDRIRFSADIVLDSLKLGANKQIYLTPVIEDANGNSEVLPSALINGRSMQISWNRGLIKASQKYTNGIEIVEKRHNGKPQTISYNVSVPMQKWMWNTTSSVKWVVDSCGCGHLAGSVAMEGKLLNLNPAERMRVSYVVPEVKPVPITIHEGQAHVQYEVNKSELHTEPYICRNGQPIDNSLELQIIDDSISYALSNKNMEIAKISICGYASPEGKYVNNEKLSTDRSRSLADYIVERYNLPIERSEYSAVAENWEGFKKLAEEDTYLNPEVKEALIELIDRPAYGPLDYDNKETTLKTDPKFRGIYSSVILPEWFPQLRTTKFEIQTRLKPLSDEQLAEVIKTDPEKLSLNQMFRVSSLYPEGSPEFNAVIDTMLKYYALDEAANLNAASAAIKRGDIDKAEQYLKKAGNSPEAENVRGVVATWQGDLDKARDFFRKAGALPEAAKNLEMLGE